MEAIECLPYKIGSLCSHTLSNSNTTHVELYCKQNQNVIHQVSQLGKICNRCASLIVKSASESQDCLCCSDKLESYLKDHWICPHSDRNNYDISIKCLDNPNTDHEVPFQTAICSKCYNKIRAAFMYAKSCLVCAEKQTEVFQNVEKTITLPSYYYFDYIIQKFNDDKVEPAIARQQIQLFCLAGQHKKTKPLYEEVFKQLDKNLEEYHISKRYDLYPRCEKHRDCPINLCNSCVVSLLNIESCPYGCAYKKEKKKMNINTSKFSQAGFISMYPKVSANEEEYLELFVFKLMEEPGRLDKWKTHIRKIRKSQSQQQSVLNQFTLYASVTQVSNDRFLYTGGAAGPDISSLKTTSDAFWINISEDRKTFTTEKCSNMKYARSSHGTVYFNNCVYSIGGFNKQSMKCVPTCQKFDMKQNKWYEIAPLKIERSKPTVFVHQGFIYVMGGLSINPQMMNNICERYDPSKNAWETLQYEGYDIPYLNGTIALSTIWNFPEYDNMLSIGGSNYESITYLIQSLNLNKKSFGINLDRMPQKINYSRMFPALSYMKIDKSDDFIVLVLGGTEEHEDLMALDAIRMKVDKEGGKKTVSPIFTYDEIMTGSYKFLLRDSDHTYSYMMKTLQKQGILNKQKYDPENPNILKSEFNLHMIEKMWYGIGKCMTGLSL